MPFYICSRIGKIIGYVKRKDISIVCIKIWRKKQTAKYDEILSKSPITQKQRIHLFTLGTYHVYVPDLGKKKKSFER